MSKRTLDSFTMSLQKTVVCCSLVLTVMITGEFNVFIPANRLDYSNSIKDSQHSREKKQYSKPNKKLSCRRRKARRAMSVEILSTAV